MMRSRRRSLFLLAAACVLLLPGSAWACACCSSEGDYYIGFSKPSEHERSILGHVRFGGRASLYVTEADVEEMSKGLAHKAEGYAVEGSLVGGAWRLTFRDGGKTGTLSLPLPGKMLSYTADTRDGRTSPGGGPLLYKEWRFEGRVTGTGFFKGGIVAPTKYFLVLQGRGNGCQDAGDFTHWRLKVTGRRADYAFYGSLAAPQ